MNHFKNSCKRYLQICCACAILIASNGLANKLYTSYLPLEKNKLTAQDIRQAFQQVLIKASGYSDINAQINSNSIKNKKIASYILSKSYKKLTQEQHYWIINFNKTQIDSLLTAKSVVIWGEPRPKVHVALISDTTNGTKQLMDSKTIPDEINKAVLSLYLNRGVEIEFIEATTEAKKIVTNYFEKVATIDESIQSINDINNEKNLVVQERDPTLADLNSLIAYDYNAEYVLVFTAYTSSTILNKSAHNIHSTKKNSTVATISPYTEEEDNDEQLFATTPSVANEPSFPPITTLQWNKVESELYNNYNLLNTQQIEQVNDASKLTRDALDEIIDFIYLKEEKAKRIQSHHQLVLHKVDSFDKYTLVLKQLQKSRWFESLQIKTIINNQIQIDLLLKGHGDEYFNALLFQRPILRMIHNSLQDSSYMQSEEDSELEDILNILEKENQPKPVQLEYINP